MKRVADVLGVARSHLYERVRRPAAPRSLLLQIRRRGTLPLIHRLVGERPTYGSRRVAALVNKVLVAEGKSRANHKRIFRIMKRHGLLYFSGTPAAAEAACTTARS